MKLSNSWMTNPVYLAQASHVLGGYSFVLTVAFLSNRFWLACVMFVLGVGLAGVKEFWYDAKYELPAQTSFDNWLDFSTYIVGGLIGLLVS